MLILLLFMNICEQITVSAGSNWSLLPVTTFISHLLHGFRDYPLVVWTNEGKLFPHLAEILVKESQERYHPVELWVTSHARWREHLKFAPGKPFYVIFPPSLASYTENMMLNMLLTFTDCQREEETWNYRQINDDVFLFISDELDGSQENPAAMQDAQMNCVTPPQLLFLKYKLETVTKMWIQLESFYALRMRCYNAYGRACIELVAKDDSHEIVNWLSSHQVRKIIQVEWQKLEQSNIFIFGLSERDVLYKYSFEWNGLKALFLGRRFRDLRSSLWTIMCKVEFFELASKVNITLTPALQHGPFQMRIVGFIGTSSIGQTTFGISPSSLSLIGGSHFEIIHRAQSSSGLNPLLAKSLSRACGGLEFGILLGLAFIITALLTPKHRAKEFFNVVTNILAPLFGQCPPHRGTDKFKVLIHLWVVLLWFVSTLYTSLLQSERVVPTTQQGNETFQDYLDRGMISYAGYRVFQTIVYTVEEGRMAYYSTKDRNQLWQLANALFKQDYYHLSFKESQEFFKLSNWGLLVESWEVRPMTDILTSFYQNDYEMLWENVYEQLEWANIQIPQLLHVARTYEGLRANGIREYWQKATLRARRDDTELGMRQALHFEKDNWDDVVFEAVNTGDSVFLEIITLCSLITSVSAGLLICQLAWIRVKDWRRSKVKTISTSEEEADS